MVKHRNMSYKHRKQMTINVSKLQEDLTILCCFIGMSVGYKVYEPGSECEGQEAQYLGNGSLWQFGESGGDGDTTQS